MGELEQNIKNSFLKVKQDFAEFTNELESIKKQLLANSELLNQLITRLDTIEKAQKEAKNSVSTGNEGVNQSINHLINQSITNQSLNQSLDQNQSINVKNDEITRNEGVNQSFNQSINHQSFNHLINQTAQEMSIKEVTNDINKTFLMLSKQELKLFLTIYQLEDEGLEASYKNVSQRMQLSEHCIRSHLSSLLKKNVPILKRRMNNHTNLLSVSKEFRALNLKKRLIGLFYEADPHQKTLFDV
jgi:hypothetical protein